MPNIVPHKKNENGDYIKICKGKLCINKNSEGIWKTLDCFSVSKSRWDKLESICRSCRSYIRSPGYKKLLNDEKEKDKKEQKENEGKKKCRGNCGLYLEYICFSKDKRGHLGLSEICRKCKSTVKDSSRVGKKARTVHTVVNGKEGKICSTCNEWKSFEENKFKKTGKYKDKTISYCSDCRICYNKKQKERYNKPEQKEKEIERKKSSNIVKKDLKIVKKFPNGKENVYNELYYNDIKRSKNNIESPYNRNENGEKFCNKCKKWLNLKNYDNDKSKEDNLYTICKKCHMSNNRNYIKNIKSCPKRHSSYRNTRATHIRNRRRFDSEFKLLCNLRNRVYRALNYGYKSDTTKKLLGCSVEFLWKHLKNQFKPGMTVENYGDVWHVDHIKPCSLFDLKMPSEQRKCFNYKNLQPLFAVENLRKGDKYVFDIVHEIKMYFIN